MTDLNANRRLILTSVIAIAGSVMTGGLWYGQRKQGERVASNAIESTFASIIDTLVPRDELPGGLDAGLEQSLAQRMAEQPKFNELVTRLLPIIERTAVTDYHRAFYRLTVDQREALLSKCLNDGSKPLQQRDLNQFRRQVLTHFYQSTVGQQSIGYTVPADYANYHV